MNINEFLSYKELDHLQSQIHTSSDNHEITVYDTTELYGEQGAFRVMQFSNQAIQGAMDLNHPERVVFEYPRAIIHLMKCNAPSFEDAFLIGHGIGTIAGYFLDKRFKVAELDSEVVELSRRYFGYIQDNVVIGDGRQILEGEETQKYDYIVLDAFTAAGTPRHLISSEFFSIAHSKLNTEGYLLMNLMGKGENDPLINAIYTTLTEQFTYIKSFSLPSDGTADIKNIIIIGGFKPIRFQARHMAGFNEIQLGQGYLIRD
ncbi:spermidine synthase [Paenibacillus sp. VTT E-133280]|jgi:spermidine synthase|uniref:spermidine synthase n=1 Tax=Paenibacillus sp. VTT E-133280 TaxID=1986222 RepID=UPI000BA0FEA4|nr:fused MFS/spermidine synthase [Paenibacillus sp. VTT E-133280]OZQ65408.1 spermidine synthase [Paenibacillus sp. VTT E-133280]